MYLYLKYFKNNHPIIEMLLSWFKNLRGLFIRLSVKFIAKRLIQTTPQRKKHCQATIPSHPSVLISQFITSVSLECVNNIQNHQVIILTNPLIIKFCILWNWISLINRYLVSFSIISHLILFNPFSN